MRFKLEMYHSSQNCYWRLNYTCWCCSNTLLQFTYAHNLEVLQEDTDFNFPALSPHPVLGGSRISLKSPKLVCRAEGWGRLGKKLKLNCKWITSLQKRSLDKLMRNTLAAPLIWGINYFRVNTHRTNQKLTRDSKPDCLKNLYKLQVAAGRQLKVRPVLIKYELINLDPAHLKRSPGKHQWRSQGSSE